MICGWAPTRHVSQEPINTNRDAEMPSQNDRSNGGSHEKITTPKKERKIGEETMLQAKVKSNGIQKKSNQDKIGKNELSKLSMRICDRQTNRVRNVKVSMCRMFSMIVSWAFKSLLANLKRV